MRERGLIIFFFQGGLEYKSPIKINRILQKSPGNKNTVCTSDSCVYAIFK